MSRRALILSGGVGHDFAATSAQVAHLLGEVGMTSVVDDDVEAALADLAASPVDLLVVNTLRWRMEAERYTNLRDDWAFSLSSRGREAIEDHLGAGRPLLALHTAPICFDDWPRWGEIVGAAWNWEHSFHPPLDEVEITVATDQHAITAGVHDFRIIDEVYGFMDVADDVEPLAWGTHSNHEHPLLWAREVGSARVVYDALGHDERSFDQASHQDIIRHASKWLVRAL